MCRMIAFAKSGKISQESDNLRVSCLKGDTNCLKNQSLKCINHYSGRSVYTVKDLMGVICKPGNPDGWGFSAYSQHCDTPLRVRGIKPAFEDFTFDTASTDIIGKKPSIMMAHIRLASKQCSDVTMDNVHPFSFGEWSFMHNGFIPGALSDEIQSVINNMYAHVLGKKPAGTTDSESAFYYFMGKLKEKYGTTDYKSIGNVNLINTFAQSITDLVSYSQDNFHQLDGKLFQVAGDIHVSPSCNFIVSQGSFLMAFCKGPKLYLGVKYFADGEKEYIVSSEIICHADKALVWLDLPENHILFMDAAKDFSPVLIPLATAANAGNIAALV